MADLRPDGEPSDIGEGLTLSTAGLLGRAEALPFGFASPDEPAVLQLRAAVESQGGHMVDHVEIEVEDVDVVAAGTTRSAGVAQSGAALTVPAPAPGMLPIAMTLDEAGMMTWHLPRTQVATGEVRAAGEYVFDLRALRPGVAPDSAEAANRGLSGWLGRKFVEVFVVPVAKRTVGRIAHAGVTAWEAANRPHSLRTFHPDTYRDALATTAVEIDDLVAWGDRRGLLLVHGTFSRATSSFGAMRREHVEALHDIYDGRVLAFDHPTVASSPSENSSWLLERLPADFRGEIDIVCSSRGGLVARRLAAHGDRLGVRRIVFSASPNAGTPLADTQHVGALIDAVTSAMNLVPDNPVTDTAEVVITILRHIAAGVADAMPGIQAMAPGDATLAELNRAAITDHRMLCSDYEPTGGVLNWVKDTGMDLIHRAPNDLVVPTESVFGPNGRAGIDPAHFTAFGPSDGVTHGGFFGRDDVHTQLGAWLAG